MRAGQRSTRRVDRVGRTYGELTVIEDIGNKIYNYPTHQYISPILKLTCKKGHIEQRNVMSLEGTGPRTRCKQCRKMNPGPIMVEKRDSEPLWYEFNERQYYSSVTTFRIIPKKQFKLEGMLVWNSRGVVIAITIANEHVLTQPVALRPYIMLKYFMELQTANAGQEIDITIDGLVERMLFYGIEEENETS